MVAIFLATSLGLSLPEQSGLLKSGKQPVQEEGAGMLRPGVPLTNVPMDSNQEAGSQLSHGVRLANGEFDKSSADLSINPWTWEPQRIQPRRQKTNFLTKKLQEKPGRDLLKRQTSFISEHDQAGDRAFENVVVKTADYDEGEKAIVPPASKLNLGSDRPPSGGKRGKKCIDSDKLLFCISSAKVSCPQI